MSPISPSLVAAGGLIGGFVAARYTKRREVGGAVFTVAGAVCQREWRRRAGPRAAAGLGVLYTAAMGGSHPLARRLGAWPSVLVMASVTSLASELVTRTAVT